MKFNHWLIVVMVVLALQSCASQKPKTLRQRLIPVAIDLLTEPSPSSSVSSFSDEPPSGSAPTSTQPEGSYPCQCRVCLCKPPWEPLTEEEFKRLQEDLKQESAASFDSQHLIVDLQMQIDDLKSQKDLLETELALYKQPKQQAMYAPVQPAFCPSGTCSPQPSNTYQRRGIFGWRR